MSGGACCSGVVDAGTPLGTERAIAGVDCYWAPTPPTGTTGAAGKSALVIVTDVFGYKLSNARLLADGMAAKLGVTAVVPDLFRNGAPPASCQAAMWTLVDSPDATFFAKLGAVGSLMWYLVPFILSNSRTASAAIIRNVISALRKDHGITNVVLAGYCWGGNVAVKLSQDLSIEGLVGVYSAHGGQLDIPKDYELIKRPACIVIAGLDFEVVPAKQEIIKKTMDKLRSEGGVVNEVHVIEGTQHGFAMRGDTSNPVVKEKRQQAEQLLADFFLRCVAEGGGGGL